MVLTWACRPVARNIHTSAVARMARRSPTASSTATPSTHTAAMQQLANYDIEKDVDDDTTMAGHLLFQQQRHALYYMRLIEHEMPKLVAYRKPFIPPSVSMPLVVRSISYGGEQHPVDVKRTIVVPLAQLPLKDTAAIHKFKLLAGPRWTPDPPPNSGVDRNESNSEHGYFKIACEDFPKAAMNLKWASDTLDKLLTEANDTRDTFADVPLDSRHLTAKARKARKGEHVYARRGVRPTIKDFPKEWLPLSDADNTFADSSSSSV
ncbi:uncharacterized protein FIBRA_00280 [Fibroporia radiculosa]|uniref:Small ribosomal subunit protein mS35 mitochondrial conserved domain-containing protein n=1 Tax=Fibroporia radiculosa TaxID=599839 RepID=J7SC01_9APHY|nr:uncharacterized protein FIBRA_00280 [Fibroporia radiculosa]CCL98286.1 predicted protein [Fibroporia radiculosa]